MATQQEILALCERKGKRYAYFMPLFDRGPFDSYDLSPEQYEWLKERLLRYPDRPDWADPTQGNHGKKGEGETMGKWDVHAKSSASGDYDVCPAGTHLGRCVALIDVGTHTEDFQGRERGVRKVALAWECHTDEGVFVVGRDYHLSFHEKSSLRQLIEKWRGNQFKDDESFDLSTLLGKPCLVSVIHKTSRAGNLYARMDGVMKPRSSDKVPNAEHTPFAWSVDDKEEFPGYDWLPYLYGKKISEVIAESHERNRHGGMKIRKEDLSPPTAQDDDDEEPF